MSCRKQAKRIFVTDSSSPGFSLQGQLPSGPPSTLHHLSTTAASPNPSPVAPLSLRFSNNRCCAESNFTMRASCVRAHITTPTATHPSGSPWIITLYTILYYTTILHYYTTTKVFSLSLTLSPFSFSLSLSSFLRYSTFFSLTFHKLLFPSLLSRTINVIFVTFTHKKRTCSHTNIFGFYVYSLLLQSYCEVLSRNACTRVFKNIIFLF